MQDWSFLKPPKTMRCGGLCLCVVFGYCFTRNEHLTAVVQVAVYQISVVKQVALTCILAGSDLRNFRFVVRAASAFTALGVPPFRIWHDAVSFVPLQEKPSGGEYLHVLLLFCLKSASTAFNCRLFLNLSGHPTPTSLFVRPPPC